MTAAKKATKETNGFDAMSAMSPEAFKEGYEKLAESVSTFADFNRNSFEAMMASTGAFSKGVEKITAENTAFAKDYYESAVAAAKTATSAKSVQEAFDIQSEFAREAVEKNIGQVNKMTELWVDTTKNTMAPLTERYSELVEKIQSYRP